MRRINMVSVILAVVISCAVYFGFKVIPVYWQAHNVESALHSVKTQATKIDLFGSSGYEETLLDKLRERILELEVDPAFLVVFFGPGYMSVHAHYRRTVHFMFGKSHNYDFELSLEIDRETTTIR